MNRLLTAVLTLVAVSSFSAVSFAAEVPAKDANLQANFHISEEATNLQQDQFNLLIMEEPQKSVRPISDRKVGLKQNCTRSSRTQMVCF